MRSVLTVCARMCVCVCVHAVYTCTVYVIVCVDTLTQSFLTLTHTQIHEEPHPGAVSTDQPTGPCSEEWWAQQSNHDGPAARDHAV